MDRTLIDSILRLKPSERMLLLNVIYGSLERPDATIDEIWYDEAERRLMAFKAGKTKDIPAEQVLAERP
jgi:putative addiction module component (TIGR02574 family)